MDKTTKDIVIVRSNRKTMSLSINDNLQPVVRVPKNISEETINAFVEKHRNWVDNAIARKAEQINRYNITFEERERLISLAKEVIPERVEYYSALMGVKPSGIKITSAKKRFGSCSSKNSLCFSYYVMLYPPQAVDYVVVHELAHIRHHNHSKDFYAFVEKYMPDYKQRENMLKNP